MRILSILLVLVLASCDTHRDLYEPVAPMLVVEGDWMPSLDRADMMGRATARFYRDGAAAVTEIFTTPTRVATRLPAGKYDVLIFNGTMFSDEQTNLDNIYFRNTGRADTFEAVARRIGTQGDEYVASNDMEPLTAAWGQIDAGGAQAGYRLKYRDGEECPLGDGEVVVRMSPRPVSYPARVVVRLVNPGSVAEGTCALNGFAGSAFMASGKPSHMRAVHNLTLGNMRVDATSAAETKTGTIESPTFVTFGPPVDIDDGSWDYTLALALTLKDGSPFEQTFDIAAQVAPVIEKLRAGLWYDPLLRPIVIEVGPVELPDVDSSVGVVPWIDNELIRVPITIANDQ